MKINIRRLSLFFAIIVSIFITGVIGASAQEVTTDYEPPAEPPVSSVFFIDDSQVFAFEQNGEKYELFKAGINIDLNDDGRCTALEAREMLRISAFLQDFDGNKALLDVSGDGRVSAIDARLVLRYSAKLDAYYMTSSGDYLTGFAKNEQGDTFYFEPNGIVANGIRTIDNNLYHFSSSGAMSHGLIKEKGTVYYFDENGKGVSGKKTVDGKLYLFENGKAFTGLKKDGDYYYYFTPDGYAATGTMTIDGVTYVFDGSFKGTIYKPSHPSEFNTAMIGDSLVATIAIYNPTDYIDFYGKVSLNSYSIFTKSITGSSRYVIDEICNRGYDKVIILTGINELDYNTNSWIAQYTKIIQGVKDRVPGVEVYVHGILPVNESRASASGYTVKNYKINEKNAALERLAAQQGVHFLNPKEALATADGSLPYEAASDGIHLGSTYCKIWSDWLLKKLCE